MPDEPEIPLLKDVVDPDEILFTENMAPGVVDETPARPLDPDALRAEIISQLNAELEPLINSAIHNVVEQVTGEIRQILLDELRGALQYRLRGLIDDALDKRLEG